MKYFALIAAGLVAEVFPQFVDLEFPGLVTDEDPTPSPVVRAVPLAERYTPEFVGGLVECPEGTLAGYVYADGVFSPPQPYVPPPPTAAEVLAQRDMRLAEATLRIAPLQDAVDLDEATPAETALLKQWKQYRVALSRIEQQAGFPATVIWPTAPA